MNEYFQPGSVPAPSASGSSAVIRQEFASIAAGFDKLPVLAGHANELISVDATGSTLVATNVLLSTFVTLAGVQTLTNKTISWAANTFPGFDANDTEAVLTIDNGGTGASDLAGAQAALGIDLKAPINNPSFTGAPTAPTPVVGDNSVRVATTQFVAETVTAIGAFSPSNLTPLMNGVASPGNGTLGSRDNHVHPVDTSRAPLASPSFTGTPVAPTATTGDNTTQVATTAFVNAEIDNDRPYSNTNPLANGTAAQGVSSRVSRQDHVHPTDTTRAPLASPTFTGVPAAPTPSTATNSTQLATTAFVQSLLAQQPAAGMQPSNTNPLMNGTAAPGTGVEGSRYDHVHPTDTSRAPSAASTATGTSFTPAGNIAATNVQAALAELDSEKAPSAASTATGTSFTPAGNIAATNVQAALAELDSEKFPKTGGDISGTVTLTSGSFGVNNGTVSATSVATGKTINMGGASADGNCFIGTSSGYLEIASLGFLLPNVSSTANAANMHRAGGEGGLVYESTSSVKFKTNIEPLTFENFDQLRPVVFDSTHKADEGKHFIGFIAEELATLDERLGDGDSYYDYRALIAILVAEVQNLRQRVSVLEAATIRVSNQ